MDGICRLRNGIAGGVFWRLALVTGCLRSYELRVRGAAPPVFRDLGNERAKISIAV